MPTLAPAAVFGLFVFAFCSILVLLGLAGYLLYQQCIRPWTWQCLNLLLDLVSDPRHGSACPWQVLVVTAHPDDEAIFFVPAIRAFQALHGHDSKFLGVTILCLSDGGAVQGLMPVRRAEALAAAHSLGVRIVLFSTTRQHWPDTLRQALKDQGPDGPPAFPDSLFLAWDPRAVAKAVRWWLGHDARMHAAPTPYRHTPIILTFDSRGVSQHPNHRACFLGVQLLTRRHRSRRRTRLPLVYQLQTWPLWAKYLGTFGWLAAWILGAWVGISSHRFDAPEHMVLAHAFDNTNHARACMRHHASQYVWFRHLFMWFSIYPRFSNLVMLR